MTTNPTRRQATALYQLLCLSDYQLSNLTEHSCDNDEARSFYLSTRDNYCEQLQFELTTNGIDTSIRALSDDAAHEVADSAPDIYNHTRMLELVGTRAYLDSSELASGNEDVLTIAGYVLYELASQLIYQLNERFAEELDSYDDEDDELADEEAPEGFAKGVC